MSLRNTTQLVQEQTPVEHGLIGKVDLPDWLLASSTEFRWLFRRDVPGYARSHYTVNWNLGTDQSKESGVREHYWRAFAQSMTIAYGASLLGTNKRVTSVINFARVTRAFAMWACHERSLASIAALNADDVAAYENYIGTLHLTQSSVLQRLSVLTAIWRFRNEIGESAGFRAYQLRGELKKAVKRLGRPNGRTRTLSPEPFFALLDHSLMLIEDGERWVALAEQYCQLRSHANKPSRDWKKVSDFPSGDVVRMARDVYGACIVVIFSLLGFRKQEVALLEVSEARLLFQQEDAVDELVGRVLKSSNGSGGTKTIRPVIPELKRAISFVARLTGIELESAVGPLFRPIALDHNLQGGDLDALDTGQIYRLIGRVVSSAEVDIVVRPHMFRRAFSMLFVWRYELGDLAYLSRLLFHNDLRHTLAYTQGDDVKAFISDAERDLARSIMERALTGREHFGGGFGALLQKFKRRLRSTTTVLRPDQIDAWLEPKLANEQFSLRALPNGYCVVLGDRGGRGACSTNGRTPNLANRTDEHCAACGNFLLPGRSRDYWQSRYDVHSTVAQVTKIDVIKNKARDAMKSAKRMLDSLRKKR